MGVFIFRLYNSYTTYYYDRVDRQKKQTHNRHTFLFWLYVVSLSRTPATAIVCSAYRSPATKRSSGTNRKKSLKPFFSVLFLHISHADESAYTAWPRCRRLGRQTTQGVAVKKTALCEKSGDKRTGPGMIICTLFVVNHKGKGKNITIARIGSETDATTVVGWSYNAIKHTKTPEEWTIFPTAIDKRKYVCTTCQFRARILL